MKTFFFHVGYDDRSGSIESPGQPQQSTPQGASPAPSPPPPSIPAQPPQQPPVQQCQQVGNSRLHHPHPLHPVYQRNHHNNLLYNSVNR